MHKLKIRNTLVLSWPTWSVHLYLSNELWVSLKYPAKVCFNRLLQWIKFKVPNSLNLEGSTVEHYTMRSNISLLIGSGFSIPEGLPGVKQLNERLSKIDESEILIHSWICNCAQWSPSFYEMAYISIDAWFMPIKRSPATNMRFSRHHTRSNHKCDAYVNRKSFWKWGAW